MKTHKKEITSQTYSISDLAAEFEISPRTIRFYEEKDLLSPRRTKGNQRIYARRDRARLKLILRGKRFGYSLEEIAQMIGMTDVNMSKAEQIEKSLVYGDMKLAEIHERIKELKLLEQDLLSVKKRLLRSLEEINR
ncbi:MAG: MerR family DNA-binding transcriptional regulator [Deltaproteobacteria bacterium]|nr:MerR family DNA-binding transcriptional regulator [Deltaproteobacteria bacterium]